MQEANGEDQYPPEAGYEDDNPQENGGGEDESVQDAVIEIPQEVKGKVESPRVTALKGRTQPEYIDW